jgi:hypothetical protein
MRKLITLVLAIGAFISIGAVGAPSALAADSTCATHSNNNNPLHAYFAGGGSSEWFTQGYDFQCGGANNEAWDLQGTYQWESDTGAWHTAVCVSAVGGVANCVSNRPQSGTYGGGEEHSGEFDGVQLDGDGMGNDNDGTALVTDDNKFCGSPGATKEHLHWRTRFTIDFAGSSPTKVYVEDILIPESLC